MIRGRATFVLGLTRRERPAQAHIRTRPCPNHCLTGGTDRVPFAWMYNMNVSFVGTPGQPNEATPCWFLFTLM